MGNCNHSCPACRIKPFDFGESEARMRNLLRRNFSGTPVMISIDEIIMDTSAKKVYYEDNTLNLTRKEYNIFEYFLMNKNRVISAEDFVEHVWDNKLKELLH